MVLLATSLIAGFFVKCCVLDSQDFRCICSGAIDMLSEAQVWCDVYAEVSGTIHRIKDLARHGVCSIDRSSGLPFLPFRTQPQAAVVFVFLKQDTL